MFFRKKCQNDRFQGQYWVSSLPYKHLISFIWSCGHDSKYAYSTKWHLSNLKLTDTQNLCLHVFYRLPSSCMRFYFRISKLLNHIMRIKLILFIIIEAWAVCYLSKQIRKTVKIAVRLQTSNSPAADFAYSLLWCADKIKMWAVNVLPDHLATMNNEYLIAVTCDEGDFCTDLITPRDGAFFHRVNGRRKIHGNYLNRLLNRSGH